MPYRLAIAKKVDKGIRTLGLQSHNLRANQLRYTHHKTSLEGFEPPTHGLEGRCSIQLSYRLKERVMGIEPTYPAWKAGVLPLNYTRI